MLSASPSFHPPITVLRAQASVLSNLGNNLLLHMCAHNLMFYCLTCLTWLLKCGISGIGKFYMIRGIFGNESWKRYRNFEICRLERNYKFIPLNLTENPHFTIEPDAKMFSRSNPVCVSISFAQCVRTHRNENSANPNR